MSETTQRDLSVPDFSAMTGLELLRAMSVLTERPPNIGSLIGMEFAELEFGKVVMELVTKPGHSNPLGSVHGGVCATLLDSVLGCAVHTTLEPGVGYSTLELKVNYIRTVPTDGRTLTATGTTVHVGRKTATAEGRVVDADGKLVAHGTTTCIIHR